MNTTEIEKLLGDEAEPLLTYRARDISREQLHLPGLDFVSRVVAGWDRGPVSILPVDQGVEHSGGASFASNPIYFDPQNIVRLAIEDGCNAVASTLGVLGACARRYAHRIPFLVMGRAPPINSGGASSGVGDLAAAVLTAVGNKRAGGLGLVSGRKAFQRPMEEGVPLLNAIQDVYLNPDIDVA